MMPTGLFYRYITGLLLLPAVNALLPTELDPFLELLFDTNECEDFIGDSEYLSVATVDCAPFKCDFPRQLCMRPSMKLTDESTNQCRDIPEKCLTAANGGVSLRKGIKITKPPLLPKPTTRLPIPEIQPTTIAETLETKEPDVVDVVIDDLCTMEQPQGRFCGFLVMYAYNRENKRCEQFWFPGCKTEETNANLFGTEDECFQATYHCHGIRPFTTKTIITTTPPSPPPQPPTTTTPTTAETESLIITPVTELPTTTRYIRPSPTVFTRPHRKPFFTVHPPKETTESIGQSFNLQSLINGATSLNTLASLGGSALTGGSGSGETGFTGAKGTLLGLITDGISQFTNSGGVDSDGESGGNFLENFNLDKIPLLIKTLQEVRTSGVSGLDLVNPLGMSTGWQQPQPQTVTYPVVSPVYTVYPPVYSQQPLPIYQQPAHRQPFRYRYVSV